MLEILHMINSIEKNSKKPLPQDLAQLREEIKQALKEQEKS